MFRFRFQSADGQDMDAPAWLRLWESKYPDSRYPGYEELVKRSNGLTADDIIQIGRWKDNARTDKWRPNVAMVTYPIWMQSASELPGTSVAKDGAMRFLAEWSGREYDEHYKDRRVQRKLFGLSRATTLLHIMSGGLVPVILNEPGARPGNASAAVTEAT